MFRVNQLYAYYGKVEIVKGISFEVKAGEIVALIGANGAGKTTILKAISGLVKSKGEIEFLGKRIERTPSDEIVKMGIAHVPEGGGVFPDMTVMENLEMGACTRNDREAIKKDYEHVFRRFPVLADRTQQLAGTLSGGERSMLAMGRGLMVRPKLFMFDEPSLGLSPLMVKEIASIIRQIHQEGGTVLLVEQNARMGLSLANRGYVVETGRITLHGQAQDLADNEHVKAAYLGR